MVGEQEKGGWLEHDGSYFDVQFMYISSQMKEVDLTQSKSSLHFPKAMEKIV